MLLQVGRQQAAGLFRLLVDDRLPLGRELRFHLLVDRRAGFVDACLLLAQHGLARCDFGVLGGELRCVRCRVDSISGAASDSVSLISVLQFGQVIVGSVMDRFPREVIWQPFGYHYQPGKSIRRLGPAGRLQSRRVPGVGVVAAPRTWQKTGGSLRSTPGAQPQEFDFAIVLVGPAPPLPCVLPISQFENRARQRLDTGLSIIDNHGCGAPGLARTNGASSAAAPPAPRPPRLGTIVGRSKTLPAP